QAVTNSPNACGSCTTSTDCRLAPRRAAAGRGGPSGDETRGASLGEGSACGVAVEPSAGLHSGLMPDLPAAGMRSCPTPRPGPHVRLSSWDAMAADPLCSTALESQPPLAFEAAEHRVAALDGGHQFRV